MKCKCCVQPFRQSESRAKQILDLIHTDICGPFSTVSYGGARYFLTFIDDMSRYSFVYTIKSKEEVFERFKEFKAMVETQTSLKIKAIRSDNGTEFVNRTFDKFLKECGITRQLSVPYTPQQNGVAERFNRTIEEMARCMLQEAEVNEPLWAEAVKTAVYIRNRCPSKSLNDTTPFEIWYKKKPCVKHLRSFGSVAICLEKKRKSKFNPKAKEYLMVGYSETSKAYRLFDPETRKIVLSRDVHFIERNYMKLNIPKIDLTTIEDDKETVIKYGENDIADVKNEETDENVESEDEEFESFENPNEEEEHIIDNKDKRVLRSGRTYNSLNLLQAENIMIPSTVREALSSDNKDNWLDAMKEEYNSLVANETFDLVDRPKGEKVLKCKWVFSTKQNKEGQVERFKARLVAKGFDQKYGINYAETFSPVVRYETIRLIFALAAEYKLHLHQMDVKTAYLNSGLQHDVYMAQPENFVDPEYPEKVLKLRKALYGLKQSGREWNNKLNDTLNSMGFYACQSEPCVYIKQGKNINIIAVYVDDLLIASSDLIELKVIKKQISESFQVIDKGQAKYFVSLEVERDGDTGTIYLCQKSQIQKLLKQYGMSHTKPISTPLEVNHQVRCDKEDCKRFNQTTYQSLIGSLMFIAIGSRPDILHSVNKLSQMNTDPHVEHFTAAKRILRYLNNTIGWKLKYEHTGKKLYGYADADWGGDSLNRKSYTGYGFVFAGAVFSWECKKQHTVALSSTEAEYMALSSAAKEAIYLKMLLKEMNIGICETVEIFDDNLGAIELVKNPIYHSRSKHIDIKYHHIRDTYRNKIINLEYCSSTEMLADILTKNLSKIPHHKLCNLLGLIEGKDKINRT